MNKIKFINTQFVNEKSIWIILSLLAPLAFFLIYCSQDVLKVDEFIHVAQIKQIQQSDYSVHPYLTTFPSYHYLIAGIANTLHLESEYYFRMINLFISFILIIVFYLSSKKTHLDKPLDQSVTRIIQFIFLPIVLPFYYLVYTDITALLCLTMAFYFYTTRNIYLPVLFATLAVLLRQPNLIWFALIPTIIFFTHFNSLSLQGFIKAIKKIWPWIIVSLGFVLFFLINGGIALGDKNKHQISLNLANLYFLIIVLFMMFWPVFLSKYNQCFRLLIDKKWIIVVLIFAYPVYDLSFTVNHIYNQVRLDYFLRNSILDLINNHLAYKILSYIIFSYTLLALTRIKLIHFKYYWIFPFAALSVLPLPLIEQRYYMVAFTLWQLTRRLSNHKVEWINTIWCICLSIFLYIGIMNEDFFL